MNSDKASITQLNEIGIALSKEKNIDALLEMIVVGCKKLTHADAGTLYLVIADSHLKFEIVHTDSLNYAMGGTTGNPINFPFIPLYKDGEPNLRMVAAYAVLQDKAVIIEDAYQSEAFDFSGTKEFDQQTGYRSTSFLTIPMKDHHDQIIGAIQLINAIDPQTGEVVAFNPDDLNLAESLTSQAAVALSRKKLEDSLRQFVDLHKTINQILMVSWENSHLQQQFSKVLEIILDIPGLGFESGGVYLDTPSGEAIYLDQNLAASAQATYQAFCQKTPYPGHEVLYLEQPVDKDHDHLVIPLSDVNNPNGNCVGSLFLSLQAEHRLSWEQELFLLSCTEPVSAILKRRQHELNLLQKNEQQQQLLQTTENTLQEILTDWTAADNTPDNCQDKNSRVKSLEANLNQLLQQFQKQNQE